MHGKGKVFGVLAAILAVTACGPPEKSWSEKFNDEFASMDINLGTPQDSPVFEFSTEQHPPHFTVILCKGATDDPRMQEESWHKFSDQVRRYGPAKSYRLDFIDVGSVVDDKPFVNAKLLVNLHEGADSGVAQDVGRKVVKVLKESSPCK